MMNYKYELFDNLKRTARLQLTSLAVITCCLFILLTLFMVHSNLDGIFSAWTKNLKVTAYLSENMRDKDIEKLMAKIQKEESVKETVFISKEEFKKDFDQKLVTAMPKLAALQSIENPFQNGLELHLKPLTKASEMNRYIEKVVEKIRDYSGIAEISYGKMWLNEYSRLSSFVGYASLFIMAALLLSLSFIIANAVKTLLEDRKKEIHILSILGATNKSIYLPFYLNVGLLLLAGFLLAIVFSLFFKVFIEKLFANHLSLLSLQIHYPGFWKILLLIVFISIFSFIGSHFHLVKMSKNRYNL